MKPLKLLILLLFCTTPALAQPKYRVVATTGMIADIVRNVALDNAEVISLMGEGVDPHLYKPTRSDIAKLASADLIFYNGLLLEGKMTDALIRVATAGKKVYAVSELIDSAFFLEPENFAGHYDPHLWMDPIAWTRAVEVVKAKLVEFDSENAAQYEENSARYVEQLEQLDAYAEKALSSIPVNQRILVTAHDAFNYFGKRYNLELVGIQGMSTESEAGVRDIERIVSVLVKRKIKSVFVESTIPQKNVHALIEGSKAKGHDVTIGGELFSDAMGQPGTYRGTYIGMLDHNITAISIALGGTAPLKGMSGKLE